ncbi:MAG TPA: nuclear transport factor 2 family protein [Candidatus Acidoferrales bacterium]|jgi:peptidoglycan hydrolase-like protein with peptidoglycan-binding domain|nr:nuclear transport factor 2 family protein [Candidatus Acidoferrales bacterium]
MQKKVIAAVCIAMLALVIAQQQRTAKASTRPMALTAQDYIEIQQLTARYGYAIDKCTNNGYDYADLYTPDGVFSVTDENGVPARATARFQGRDRLAEADGGGKGGCVDPKTVPDRYSMAHIVANLVITPTPEGATGKSYLLVVGFGDPTAKQDARAPVTAYEWGRYDDVYVKTPNGWRFKSRVHVWPGMPASLRAH